MVLSVCGCVCMGVWVWVCMCVCERVWVCMGVCVITLESFDISTQFMGARYDQKLEFQKDSVSPLVYLGNDTR